MGCVGRCRRQDGPRPRRGSGRRRPPRRPRRSARAGQRGWKRQPAGIRVGSGVSPAAAPGSQRVDLGDDARAAPWCRGAAGRPAPARSGPARRCGPRYITAMRSAMFHARPRSWVTTRTERPSSSRSRAAAPGSRPGPRRRGCDTARPRPAAPAPGPARRRSPPAGAGRRTARAGRRQEEAPRRAQAGCGPGRRRPASPRRPDAVDAQPLGDRLVDRAGAGSGPRSGPARTSWTSPPVRA